jgi:hypothetical protein
LKKFAAGLALIISCSSVTWAQQPEPGKEQSRESSSSLGLDNVEAGAKVAQNSNPAGAAQMQNTMDLIGATPKRWGVNLHSENWMLIQDQEQLKSEAPLTSLNAIGLVYNVNKIWSVELRQYAEYASNVQNMGDEDQQKHQNNFEWDALTLLVKAESTLTIGNSKPLTTDFRYYAPTDRLSREAKQAGLLRSDTYTEWNLSPKWAIGGLLSPRIQLNTADNPNTEKGADAEYYRLNISPSMNYYWTDLLSAYYAYTLNLRSTQAQRGDWRVDEGGDSSWHDIGLYVAWGQVLFNPSLMSRISHEDHQNSVFTGDSRVFAHDNTTYNFNVYAEF